MICVEPRSESRTAAQPGRVIASVSCASQVAKEIRVN